MSIEVVNIRGKSKNLDACNVYIGNWTWTTKQSPWGNPFKEGRDGTREEVVEKYREWIEQRPHLVDDLAEAVEKYGGRLGLTTML